MRVLAAAFAVALMLRPGWAGAADAPDDAPLRAGLVPDSPPFVTSGENAAPAGLTVDLFRDIARRLRRPIQFSQAPMPALVSALHAGKLDVLAGPIGATPERSAQMLFTEGYVWSEYQFATRPGVSITSPDDLRGKRLAVQAGTEYADWAELNAHRHGFALETLPTLKQVLDAVRSGKADVCLADSAALIAASHAQDTLAPGLALAETKVQGAAAVANTDDELRDELDDMLACLKKDGTLARLSERWLGEKPGGEDLQVMVVPGNGVPGLTGYDPKPRKLRCGAS